MLMQLKAPATVAAAPGCEPNLYGVRLMAKSRAPHFKKRAKPCAHCGDEFFAVSSFKGVYCSYNCKSRAAQQRYGLPGRRKVEEPAKPTTATRSRRLSSRMAGANVIAAAVKTGDRDAILAAIRSVCDVTDIGCWIPKPECADYPHQAVPTYQTVWLGDEGGTVGLHRLSLETHQGISLGSVHCHHICAIRPCCNPEHLQPATQINNTLEMRERHAFRHRIADLEGALRDLSPEHPLLWGPEWSESRSA